MKAITVLDCPNCKQDFSLGKCQRGFVKQAAGRGMSFILLECQQCGFRLEFNPLRSEICHDAAGDSEPEPEPEPSLTQKEKRAILKRFNERASYYPNATRACS